MRRRDWAIAAMAGLNRCVFWFHPLAWWLERQLARLAEQACDDAAIGVVKDRRQYAETLLEIARAIQTSKGRVLAVSSLAAPMAKEANVEIRIDRILDETRRIPKALGRRGWMTLVGCAVPLMYLAAAIQLAPAQTVMPIPQPAPPSPPAVVTIAQAAAPPNTPAPLTAPAPLKSPAPQQAPAVTPPRQPLTPVQPLQVAPADGPFFIPKVYNGQNRTFYFFRDGRSRPVQAQVSVSPTSAAGPGLEVSVTSVLVTTISIPLDPAGQYEISGRVTTLEGKFVTSFDDLVDSRESLEKELRLKAGMYRLDVVVRDRNDGRMETRDMRFEVE